MELMFNGSNPQSYQSGLNKGMAVGRVKIEWIFEEIKAYFTKVDLKRKMKVMESPAGSLYFSAMWLYNISLFLCPPQTSLYFSWLPPASNKYLEVSYLNKE